MQRRLRIVGLIVIVILAGVVGTGWFLTRHYNAASQVVERVEERLGGKVVLSRATVGFHGTTLEGLKLYDSSQDRSTPWLSVDRLQAEASLWQLLHGAMPRRLTLHGVSLYLRFDRAGHLLTRFAANPSAAADGGAGLPELVVDDADVTIAQEGRPVFTIHGAALRLAPEVEKIVVTGSASDPEWGDWELHGEASTDLATVDVTMTSARVRFTQPMLDQLPFVPPVVWNTVRCAGETSAEFNLKNGGPANGLSFHLTLEPNLTALYLPALDLRSDSTRGKVVVDNRQVRVIDAHTRFADGTAITNATLAFLERPQRLSIEVMATDVNVQKVPKSWDLPPEIGGKLSGHAGLVVLFHDGRQEFNGKGEGVIKDATVAGLPAEPITLHIHPAGKGYRFRTPAPGGASAVPIEPALLGIGLQLGLAQEDDGADQKPRARPSDRYLPSRLFNDLLSTTNQAVNGMVNGGVRAMGSLPSLTRPRPGDPAETPRYVDVNLKLDNVDVAALAQRLKISLPIAIAGNASVKVKLSVPLTGVREPRRYRVEGAITSDKLVVAGLPLRQIVAHLAYHDGVGMLDPLSGTIGEAGDAAFRGSAHVALFPLGDAAMHLQVHDVATSEVLRALPALAVGTRGTVSGVVDATIRGARFPDPQAWDVTGMLRGPRVQAFGAALEDFVVDLRIREGAMTATLAHGTLAGAPATGTLTVEAAAPYRYRVRAATHDLALPQLREVDLWPQLPFALKGKLKLNAVAAGTLAPFTLQASGDGAADETSAEGVIVQHLQFQWQADPNHIQLTTLDGLLFGGTFAGSATVPFRANEAGKLGVRFSDVDLAGLRATSLPLQLSGQASGTVRVSLSPAAAGARRALDARMNVEAPRLRVEGIPTERLTGTITYKDRALEYHLKGNTLGGDFSLDGMVPAPAAKPPPAPAAPQGRLRVRGARLADLWEPMHLDRFLGPLAGGVNLDLDFDHVGMGDPTSAGRVTLTDLRWGDNRLSEGSVTAALRLTPRELQVDTLNGIVAQGVLGGRMVYDLRDRERSYFNVALDHAAVASLLLPWPGLAAGSQGSVDLRLIGRLGRDWSATLNAAMNRGRIAGVDVASVLVPIRIHYSPVSGDVEASTYDGNLVVAGGRVATQLHYTSMAGNRIYGDVRFHDVDLPALLRQFADVSRYGTGKMTGRIHVEGSNVHSLNDLATTIEATLSQTQAFQFPVLSQITPFLPLAGSSSVLFQRGSLRASSAGGALRIQRLELSGSLLQLIVEGTISRAGTLNLEATGNTRLLNPGRGILARLAGAVPAAGAVPLTALTAATASLSGSVIHLRIRGTISHATIQVEPLSLLSQEAFLFFVARAWAVVP